MGKATNTYSGKVAEPKRHSLLVDLLIRLVKEKPLGAAGGVVVLMFFLVGIFADFLAPYGVNEIHPNDLLQPPSAQYLLGTDNLGRDLCTRVIFGARTSMLVGVIATTIATIIATVVGLVSGFIGGKLDIVVQRFVDAFMCFPPLIFLITVISLIGIGLWQVIIVLGLQYGINTSRVIRSAVIAIKEEVYVEAAQAIGCSTTRVLTRHILPNIMAPIIIIFTIRMGAVIIAEASLSFLGLGIPPPNPSWGGMLSRTGRYYMLISPWLALWPGLALAIVVYGINMLGDALRDILDPRLRGGLGRYGGVKRKIMIRRLRGSNQ